MVRTVVESIPLEEITEAIFGFMVQDLGNLEKVSQPTPDERLDRTILETRIAEYAQANPVRARVVSSWYPCLW